MLQHAPATSVTQQQKPKAAPAAKARENKPGTTSPTRAAKRSEPRIVEAPPAKVDTLQPAEVEAVASVPQETIADKPAPQSVILDAVAAAPPVQAATAPAAEDVTTATASPAQASKPDGDAEAVELKQSDASPASQVETIALATAALAELQVAILLVRPDINSISDLANKTIAIDASRAGSVADVRAAVMSAGAADVQVSESETMAAIRVIEGEVSAAVVTIASPDVAEQWSSGDAGFRILRVPLALQSAKAPRG